MRTYKNDEGMALVVAMIFMIIMGITATYTASRAMNNSRHVVKYVDIENCFEGLDSVMALAQADLGAAGGFVGIDPAYDFTLGMPNWNTPGLVPQSLASRPEVQFCSFALDWSTDGIDNNGDGQIDVGPETDGYITVYGMSRIMRNGNVGAQRMAEQIFLVGAGTSVWENAIFAGAGQAGGLINGNVSIHGSVHLLGDNVGLGGISLEALDLGGTSLIHNNYEGLSADLAGRVPALNTVMFDGESVESLDAKLRVKNGLVGMSGNSEVGEPHQTGNDFKETMDGVFVTDGWTGNDLDVNGDPQSVWSDNGWDSGYDLGNNITFPTFTDDGGTDYLAYYLELDAGLQNVYSGDMTIQPGGGNFYWNATTGTEVEEGTPGDGSMPLQADLGTDDFYVWFDDATDTLIINGRIPVDGDIHLVAGSGNSNKLIDYEGAGSLLAFNGGSGGGDIEISASLKTTGFPGNVIGIMAEGNLRLGTLSQLEIMGGFYAQGTISANKQTTILGTIVGGFFDMGGQVPDIYQVPALSAAWRDEMRMIGSDPSSNTFTPISWRELAVL